MGGMVGGQAASVDRGSQMTARQNSPRDYIAVLVARRGVYLRGRRQSSRSVQFADNIAAFSILPAMFINLLALSLPPFEIACGLMLVAPRTRRIGALAVALISVVFFSAILSALVRGLTLDCGCFGSGTPSRPRMWAELVLDVLLFGGAVLVYFYSILSSLRRRDSIPPHGTWARASVHAR